MKPSLKKNFQNFDEVVDYLYNENFVVKPNSNNRLNWVSKCGLIDAIVTPNPISNQYAVDYYA